MFPNIFSYILSLSLSFSPNLEDRAKSSAISHWTFDSASYCFLDLCFLINKMGVGMFKLTQVRQRPSAAQAER